MGSLRLVFFGTAELARVSLAALAAAPDFTIRGVVTQPDRPKGRELKLQPPPVKVEASQRQLTVLQPERARDPKFLEVLAQLEPELIVVAAYGQILPPAILDLPKWGCLNVHASLLPKYRGAAPIQWAILNGERETGITIMKMDAGLDTGDMLTQEKVTIGAQDNAQTIHDRLAAVGASLLLRTIPDYIAGNVRPIPQPKEGATYARKITKADGALDWNQPAVSLWNRVRALTPWPGAFTFLPNEAKQPLLKIREAEPDSSATGRPGEVIQAGREGIVVRCGDSSLRLVRVQREGSRPLTAQEFLAGYHLSPGTRLGPASLSSPPPG
jgi:methionyl-tRNA formyltransferase